MTSSRAEPPAGTDRPRRPAPSPPPDPASRNFPWGEGGPIAALKAEVRLWASLPGELARRVGRGLRTLRSAPKEVLHRTLRDPRTLLAAMVLAFTGLFGAVGHLRYWSFQTFAWDMGIYNQAMSTTLFDGRWFYYTADLPAGTGGSLFAVHFSPFLFLILPFYALAPGVSTLLVLQAFGVAAGALPLYGFAKVRLGSTRWGLLLAAIYLVNPVTQGLTWYDFHPEAFLPVAVLSSIYFLHVGRPRRFVLSWFLALSIVETVAPFLALSALLGILSLRRSRATAGTSESRRVERWLASALVVAVLWLGLAYLALVSFGTSYGGAFGVNYGVNWSILGAPSPLWVFPTAVLHPDRALAALSYQADGKIVYMVLLFAPLLLLPWFGEDRFLLPALAWTGMAVLSNSSIYYELGDQYSAYVLPFLMAGTVGGLVAVRPYLARAAKRVPRPAGRSRGRALLRRRARPRPLSRGADRMLMGALAAGAVLGSLTASPLLLAPAGAFQEISYGWPVLTPHEALLHQVLELVPPGASILTTTTIFPELSDRSNAYVLPTSSYFAGSATFGGYLGRYVNESSFVLEDYRLDPYSSVILDTFANLSAFGLRASVDGANLYERGWTGAPDPYVPWGTVVYAPTSLTPGDTVIDPSASGPNGPSLYHAAGTANGTQLWSGLDLYPVPPGVYQVTLELRARSPAGGPALGAAVLHAPVGVSLDLVNPSPAGHDYGFVESLNSAPSVLTSGTLTLPLNGTSSPSWQNLTMTVSWPSVGLLNCQGWALSSSSELWLYGITITQTSPAPS